jgi:hypothetical protein
MEQKIHPKYINPAAQIVTAVGEKCIYYIHRYCQK